MILRSAVEHYRRQQRIVAAALRFARRAWVAGDLPQLTAQVTLLQQLAAQESAAAVPAMMTEQGIAVVSSLTVLAGQFAGYASDGRGLQSLFEQAASPRQLELMVTTQLQDAGRAAGGVAIAAQPEVQGYVRMINPPSCSRCVVLAGKFFRWNAGFERHPRCDCRHIPAAEDSFDDITTDPLGYFRSLSTLEQDQVFGKAGAQAIRDGADIGQVVNARQGMAIAGVGGRRVQVTTSGTTRRGYFSYVRREIDRQRGEQTAFTARSVGPRGAVGHYVERRVARPRLMPEQIYLIAGGDRAEALRLLAANGYIVGAIDQVARMATGA